MSNNFFSSNFLRWLTLYLLLALAILLFIANLYNTPNTSASPARTPTPATTPSKSHKQMPTPTTPNSAVTPTSTPSSTPSRTPTATPSHNNSPTPSPTRSSQSDTTVLFISHQSGVQRNRVLLCGAPGYLRTLMDYGYSSKVCFHNSKP